MVKHLRSFGRVGRSPFRRALFPLLVLLALGSVGGVREASAGRAWCAVDPVVMIDGQLADVFLASDLGMLTAATGPAQIVISIPAGSSGSVILTDLGFGGHGYAISFVQTAALTRTARHTPVTVSAFAPATDSTLPLKVTFAPRSLSGGILPLLGAASPGPPIVGWR